MPYLPTVEKETGTSIDASVIWLHGLGADGHDFASVIPDLRLPQSAAIRFIFPHAPSIAVTINNGAVMPAWYDILEMDFDRKVDAVELQQSADAIKALIDREIDRGIDSQRIIVAGFSQGGAVAYQTALCYHRPLAGIMGLSTYFPTHESIKCDPINQNIPIFICHGTADPVVPEPLGRKSQEILTDMGYRTEYKTYPMEHSVCMEEIGDISKWLQSILN